MEKEFESVTRALYVLCNRKNLFTCGSCSQYDKMFKRARKADKDTIRDVAIMIWTCSDNTYTFDEIFDMVLDYYQRAEVL